MNEYAENPQVRDQYSILAKASQADIRLDPFPHILIENALPAETYNALADNFPSLAYVAGDQAGMNNLATLRGSAKVLSDVSLASCWRDFFSYHLSAAFFHEFINLWGPTVDRAYPLLEENFGKPLSAFDIGTRSSGRASAEENLACDLVLDCVFGTNTPVQTPTQVRGAHADIPHKLFSSLLYFRDPADDSEGGEYQLYRMKRRIYPKSLRKHVPMRYLETAVSAPYRANTLIFWLNGAESVHAVSTRSATPFSRRYVAVAGECYGGRETSGYFAQHPQWQTPIGRCRSWLNL